MKKSNFEGKHHSEETKLKISLAKRGKHCSLATEFKKGCVSPNKGKKGTWFNTGKTHFKKGEHVGDKHPNWKGGRTPRHNSWEWKSVALKVWRRDSFTCQVCGVRLGLGVKPIAHHRIPYDLLPENDEGNLITLCNSCHLKVHWKIRKEGVFPFAQ